MGIFCNINTVVNINEIMRGKLPKYGKGNENQKNGDVDSWVLKYHMFTYPQQLAIREDVCQNLEQI